MRLHDGRVVPAFISQALEGRPLTVYGDGLQTRSFCYCTDLIEGIYRLMLRGSAQPVNIGNPQELTVLEFARQIIKATRSKSRIVFKPLPKDDPRQRRPDITRARQELGWRPRTSLEEGLALTIGWFRESGRWRTR
jgi:dTDP-glucose 4,6-dehydratase